MKKRVLLMLLMLIFTACFYNMGHTKTASAEAVSTLPVTTPINNITIMQYPSKLTYTRGESLDLTGLVLQAYYADGTSSIITNYTTSGLNTDIVGVQKVIVTYQGFSAEFSVTVFPPKVTHITCIGYTTASVTLSWDTVTGANHYEIYTYNPVDGSRTMSFVANTNSITLLYPAATIFNIEICAVVNSSGIDYRGDYSDPFTGATAPTGTSVVSVLGVSAKMVSLVWNPVAGATGYVVFRSANMGKTYSVSGLSTTTDYTDLKAAPGTAYLYKVCPYVYNKNFIGMDSNVVDISTNPDKMQLKCKPGDQKLRVSWTALTGATYYDIYMADALGNYTLVTTRKATSTCAYVIEGLTMGQTYSLYAVARREYNGFEYRGENSDVSSVLLTELVSTSTQAKVYLTKEDFLSSASYTDIAFFKKNVKYTKSFVMPGLISANIDGFVSTTMCPQAITFAGNYLLQTAYDMSAEENSVIYVMDKTTQQLITTLVLPSKTHAGGIAFDGSNIWISNGTKISAIRIQQLMDGIASAKPSYKVKFDVTIPIGITTSYVTFYNDRLWIGSYDELKSTQMYCYSIQNKEDSPKISEIASVIMPSRVQGVTFTADGTMILSRSCQLYQGLRGYMRQLDLYRLDCSSEADGVIAIGQLINSVPMPSMNEGIAIDGSYLFVNYESAAFDKATYKMDRICAFKLSSLTTKAS